MDPYFVPFWIAELVQLSELTTTEPHLGIMIIRKFNSLAAARVWLISSPKFTRVSVSFHCIMFQPP
jgi:hypothetical protein